MFRAASSPEQYSYCTVCCILGLLVREFTLVGIVSISVAALSSISVFYCCFGVAFARDPSTTTYSMVTRVHSRAGHSANNGTSIELPLCFIGAFLALLCAVSSSEEYLVALYV